jgi:hypothetical protein
MIMFPKNTTATILDINKSLFIKDLIYYISLTSVYILIVHVYLYITDIVCKCPTWDNYS